jgi:hypothetical protein
VRWINQLKNKPAPKLKELPQAANRNRWPAEAFQIAVTLRQCLASEGGNGLTSYAALAITLLDQWLGHS